LKTSAKRKNFAQSSKGHGSQNHTQNNFVWTVRRSIRSNLIIDPEALKKLRADSFVMETNIHYPAESSLIRDGLRKILEMCSELAVGDSILGWRQHHHLWKRVKQLAREIDRIAGKKGPNYVRRMKEPYRELLRKAAMITQRARELCMTSATRVSRSKPRRLFRSCSITGLSECRLIVVFIRL